ncbi:hypothetical protein [Tateyamaria sp.]|uniref:hypothetical protein n=1 Tax=Tateyamaria sp. TaxID=1929288 RepID=UPI003B210FAD
MKALLALFLLCATPLAAQNVIPKGQGDAALFAALQQPNQIVDGAATWPIDWDRQPPLDLIVQAVYASAYGGNATSLEYRIVTPVQGGYVMGAPFELPGAGIKEVQTHPEGAVLIQYQYRDGDPRCCPSGIVSTILARVVP